MKRTIDSKDREILSILQSDARASNADIARRIGMAQSATLERVRKLEERGLICGYHAHLDPSALGLGLLAFVYVRTSEAAGDVTVAEELAALPEVLEVHHVAGEDCYLAKVRAADPKQIGALLREKLAAMGTVVLTKTTIVLETLKESTELPLP